MGSRADHSRSSNFPLPADLTENPIRANHPRQLIINDGDWEPCTDNNALAGKDYIAVSYRRSDFPNKKALEKLVRNICFDQGIKAYWIDFACIGETPEEKNVDIYRIADVFRNAKKTLILIKGEDGKPLSIGWESWGKRIWIYPEALLSKNFIIQIGLNYVPNGVTVMTLDKVANHAYGSDNEKERMLIQLYSNMGKDFSEIPERLEMLCEAIWDRKSGPDPSVAQSSSALTAYPGEKVYALMGFLLRRIWPRSDESEDEAFKRLLDENGLRCDQYPSVAYGAGGTRILGIKSKKDALARESYVLPRHIPEARFDYNRDRKRCEEGTRMEILDEIFGWIGHNGQQDRKNTSTNTKLSTNVLWLSGLAGSGKSTIAQTAAEKCRDEHILGASFFCYRSNASLSNYLNIFPTICRRLCDLDEDFKRKVSEIYEKDMDLQHAEPDHQLKTLIVDPLAAAQQFPFCVVIIDALDECSDIDTRSKILYALDEYIDKLKPLKFLITSRPDDDINVAFRTLSLGDDTEKVNLDEVDPTQTDRDLRIVLTKGLTVARKRFYLPDTWPSEEDVSDLVEQAQHLFIFVSTAIIFIGESSASDPKSRLDLLLNPWKITSKSSPYAYLDNLYREVFSSAFLEIEEELREKLQTILGILVLSEEQFSVSRLAEFSRLQSWEVRSTLSNLHALIVVPENNNEDIRLIHSSIHDFLTDKNRCTDHRFVVDTAAGHSTIAGCCFKTLARFAESEEMHPFIQAPTREKLDSLKKSIEQNRDSAIYYAYAYWKDHMDDSDLNEDIIEDFQRLLSNQCKYLLRNSPAFAGTTLLKCISEMPKQHPSQIEFAQILYECALSLIGEKFTENSYFYFKTEKELRNAQEMLRTEYGYKNGLFGLNETSAEVEVIIISLQDYIPKKDVPEMDISIRELKRVAVETRRKIFQQTIPEDEQLHSHLLALMKRFDSQLLNIAGGLHELKWDSDGYVKILDMHISALIILMGAFNEILDCVLNNNLDNVLTENIRKAFSEADGSRIIVLRVILAVGLLGLDSLVSLDLEGLLSLLDLPTDTYFMSIFQLSLLAGALVKNVLQIQLISPTLFSTFLYKSNSSDNRFFIDLAIEHSRIVMHCMHRLIQFTSTPEMKSYQIDPSRKKFNTLQSDLSDGNDVALIYAYKYWILHIDKSDGQLDKSALQLLEVLISNHRALGVIVENEDDAIPVFLNLFDKLSLRPSPPCDILKRLYDVAIYLCSTFWPTYVGKIVRCAEDIKKTRETLKTNFSYKDGLYELDLSFPLLQIAILSCSYNLTYESVPDLENDIHELRNYANGVHELIMQQAVPEDEKVCLALTECLTALYKGLKLSYETYKISRSLGSDKKALPTSLYVWNKIFKNFWAKVHEILGIPDNVRWLDTDIVDYLEQAEIGKSATISELHNKHNNDEANAPFNDAAKHMTTNIPTSSRSSLLTDLPPSMLEESTSKDNAAEVGSYIWMVMQMSSFDASINQLSQDGSIADQSDDNTKNDFELTNTNKSAGQWSSCYLQ